MFLVLGAFFGHVHISYMDLSLDFWQQCMATCLFYGHLCVLYTNQLDNSLQSWGRYMQINGNDSKMFSFISHVKIVFSV